MPGQITNFSPGALNMTPILSDFQPVANLVSDVTNALQAEVTTPSPHGWSSGMIVQVIIPLAYGMVLNDSTPIVVTGSTTFTTDLDTTQQAAFVEPTFTPDTNSGFTSAQAVPIDGFLYNAAGGNT